MGPLLADRRRGAAQEKIGGGRLAASCQARRTRRAPCSHSRGRAILGGLAAPLDPGGSLHRASVCPQQRPQHDPVSEMGGQGDENAVPATEGRAEEARGQVGHCTQQGENDEHSQGPDAQAE